MRIQHNIMAMNAYRNYNNNTSALSKNLEKLSSGYKINRAGDDAAGLAISEKMRAQITGLKAAQKNVKDGISLVKTAEGAMQEIEDMLNRMKYLATQSANGTYDSDVDRANLQKEVISLKSEINRIADSANFNGIKLLDGSMSGAGAGGDSEGVTVDAAQLKTITDAIAAKTGYTAGTASGKAKQEIDLSGLTFDKAGTVTVTMGGKTYDVDVTEGMDGKAFATKLAAAYTAADAADQIADAASGKYAVTADTAGKLTILASGNGVTDADSPFKDFNIEPKAAPATQADADAAVGPTFKGDTTALAKFGIVSVSADDLTLDKATDVTAGYDGAAGKLTVTIDGKAYEKTFANTGEDAADIKGKVLELAAADGKKIKVTMDSDVSKVLIGKDKTTDVEKGGVKIGSLDPAAPDGGNGNGAAPKGALQLQIGDDAATYNQLFVSIGSMKTNAFMGQKFTMSTDPTTGITTYTANGGDTLDGIDISTIGGATSAIDTIKQAINYVSSVRGDLGATQNRLDHTANNLSVMTENIQDAESTIRDTDVAEEMMAYTKNNILIQSAQAMLAQANAVPQGVLQLLQ